MMLNVHLEHLIAALTLLYLTQMVVMQYMRQYSTTRTSMFLYFLIGCVVSLPAFAAALVLLPQLWPI